MTVSTELVAQIQGVVVSAKQAGLRPPGRPTLVKMTGATDHQVKQALAQVRQQPPAPVEEPPVEHQAEPEVAPVAPAGEPVRHGRVSRPWPLVLIGIGASVSVWAGWVGLGTLAGFGVVRPLPGIWDGLEINTAVTLPVAVEAYGVFALRVWLGSAWLSARTRGFARRSAIASLVIGAVAQVAYHLLVAAGVHQAPWPVVVLVATVPVMTLGLAAGLAHLVAADGREEQSWP